jgi:hypothetical protein
VRGRGITYDTGFFRSPRWPAPPSTPRSSGPHRGDPERDLDMASSGVVKVLEDRPGRTYPGMAWEPKAVFAALAGYYGRNAARSSAR